MSAHSSNLLRRNPINLVDEVARHLAARSLHKAADEEEHVERACRPVQHLVLRSLVSEGKSARSFIEPINVAHVSRLGVADLVKLQWLIFKSVFAGERVGKQVARGPDDVTRHLGADVEIDLGDLSITLHVDRVSVDRWLHEVPGVAERLLIGTARVRILHDIPAVVRQASQKAAPMPHEGGERVEGHWKQSAASHERTSRDRDEFSDDAALGDPVDVKPRGLVARLASVFVGDRGKRSGQIEKVQRNFILDFDRKSRLRLAHLLGPQRYILDDSPLRAQFHGDGRVSIRDRAGA